MTHNLEDVRSAIFGAGETVYSIGRYKLASLLDCKTNQARRYLKALRAKEHLTANQAAEEKHQSKFRQESVSVSGDSMTVEIPQTRIKSLEELVAQFQVDTSIWECKRFRANKWEVGVKVGEDIQVSPLYQVRADFERVKGWNNAAIKAELDRIVADAHDRLWVERAPYLKTSKMSHSGYMAEIAIVDHHYGSLSWKPETGQANYDHKIAAKMYIDAFSDLLGRMSYYNPDQIVILLGNDHLNADSIAGMTTSGTPQVNDARFAKVWNAAWDKTITAIDMALDIAQVKIIVMPGNHDRNAAWSFGHSLSAYYHSDTRVDIDNTPRVRKYHRYGVNMIGFCHGDTIKLDKLPLLMATEEPQMFASTKRREWHTGHFHHAKMIEQNGIRVRSLPSLVAPNEWATAHGYTMSTRASQGFLWSKDRGLMDIKEYSVDADAE